MLNYFCVGSILIAATIFTGCSTTRVAADHPQDSRPASVLNEGYSLLYQLMSDEKDVSKLLIIKREPAEVTTAIKDISHRSAEAHKQLELFAKEDPSLNLKLKPLPLIEQQTRDAIGKARGKELVFQNSRKIEIPLLLTQVEALGYGTYLAKTVALNDPNPTRKQYLEQLSTDLGALRGRTVDLLPSSAEHPVK